MTKEPSYTEGANTWDDVWSVSLTDDYDRIRFANMEMTDSKNDGKYGGKATDTLTIPTDDNNCFYADTGDTSVYYDQYKESAYVTDNYFRGGNWGAVHSITFLGDTINHAALGTETQNNHKLYVNTTFYDYFSDLELNGFDRENLTAIASANPPTLGYNNRTYMTHRIFNMALSDYYRKNTASNPLYFGHFQCNAGNTGYSHIAADMNLYGYDDNQNWFYHINNSTYRSDSSTLNHPADVATQGLVCQTLTADDSLQLKEGVLAPFFNKSFLEGTNSYHTALGKVYDSVSFPFTKEGDYWKFDSTKTNLRMSCDSDKNKYFLQETSEAVKGYTNGAATENPNFFPFDDAATSGNTNELNYGFGMKMEINFRLTEDGTIIDSTGSEQDITFHFSGDDDIWIFIDGKLALDIGGGHGKVSGDLNFKTKKATVSKVKTTSGEEANVVSEFTLSGANTDQHTLTMYYMERGLWESNMLITFNFPDDNVFAIEKEVDTSNLNPIFSNDSTFDENVKNLVFDFDIKNLATHYDPCTVDDMNTTESTAGFIMKQPNISDYGSVTSGKAEPVNGAKYSLFTRNADNTADLSGTANGNVVADGTVSLNDKQLVKFSNKFRRGSYIVVNEKVSPMIQTLSGLSGSDLDQLSLTDIFDTIYSIYHSENDISAADLQKDTQWVNGSALSSVKNISGLNADDGRTEKLTEGNTDLNGTAITNTTITEQPFAAILFRNYTNPDSETVAVNLSVKYVNQFKTGAIAVTKAQAAESQTLDSDSEYSFTVTFDNAAGLKLEDSLNGSYATTKDNKLTYSFKLKVGETETIKGIPAGTDYTITESTPADGSSLVSITDSLAEQTAPAGVKKDSVSITAANTVNGTIAADTVTTTVQTFTFYNNKEAAPAPPDDPTPPTPDNPTPDNPTPAPPTTQDPTPTPPSTQDPTPAPAPSEDPVPTPENPALTTISITKVDSSDTDKTLKGAAFRLEKLNTDGSVDTKFKTRTLTTPASGIITFKDLSDGTYRLTETKAPDGYILLTDSVSITIQDGKYILENKSEKTIKNQMISFIIMNRAKKTSTPSNQNPANTGTNPSTSGTNTSGMNTSGISPSSKKTAGLSQSAKLPQTGGPGTILYTLVGVAFMGSAMVVLFHQKKKGTYK